MFLYIWQWQIQRDKTNHCIGAIFRVFFYLFWRWAHKIRFLPCYPRLISFSILPRLSRKAGINTMLIPRLCCPPFQCSTNNTFYTDSTRLLLLCYKWLQGQWRTLSQMLSIVYRRLFRGKLKACIAFGGSSLFYYLLTHSCTHQHHSCKQFIHHIKTHTTSLQLRYFRFPCCD